MICTGGAWKLDNGVIQYTPLGFMRRTIECQEYVKYTEFKSRVSAKVNLPFDGFRMTYQLPVSSSNQNNTVVVDIADDEDLQVFIKEALNTTHGPATLYVVKD
ncbi:hypothetical protein Hanom_Chr07g00595971 [Helianthus anomalus]